MGGDPNDVLMYLQFFSAPNNFSSEAVQLLTGYDDGWTNLARHLSRSYAHCIGWLFNFPNPTDLKCLIYPH